MTALIGGANAAFLGVSDLQRHLDLFVGQLGWEIHARGCFAADETARLWGAGIGVLPWTELRAAGAGHGRLVLLEVPAQPCPAHPLQADTGLVAINMYTRDIDASYEVLSAAGQEFRTPPATWAVPLGDKVVSVTQMFLLAPDGVDIVFVQPAVARGTAAWDRDPDRHYTELTSVVCHVEDFEAETRFWGPDGLGLQSWYDVSFTHPGLDEMAQLPAGSIMRLSFLAGDSTARLEVTRLDDRTLGDDRRPYQRTGRHLGHTGWLFRVGDIDATLARVVDLGGEILTPAHAGPREFFEGARVAFVNTPNGFPVTFMEVDRTSLRAPHPTDDESTRP